MAVESVSSYLSPCQNDHHLHSQVACVLSGETHQTILHNQSQSSGVRTNNSELHCNPFVRSFVHSFIRQSLTTFYQAFCQAGLEKRTLPTFTNLWSCYIKNYFLKRGTFFVSFCQFTLITNHQNPRQRNAFQVCCFLVLLFVSVPY